MPFFFRPGKGDIVIGHFPDRGRRGLVVRQQCGFELSFASNDANTHSKDSSTELSICPSSLFLSRIVESHKVSLAMPELFEA